MAELFTLAESLSPRLKWQREHDLVIEETHCAGESPETGEEIPAWVCRVRVPRMPSGLYCPNEIGGGDTAEEAIVDFCQNSGVKHYSLP